MLNGVLFRFTDFVSAVICTSGHMYQQKKEGLRVLIVLKRGGNKNFS